MAAYRRVFMTHVACRLTAKNRDQLWNPTLGNRVSATFTFSTCFHGFEAATGVAGSIPLPPGATTLGKLFARFWPRNFQVDPLQLIVCGLLTFSAKGTKSCSCNLLMKMPTNATKIYKNRTRLTRNMGQFKNDPPTFYYYYAAFNAPCVGHMDDESQAQSI